MIAEIVSNGMLSLPSSLAVVGIVPGLVIIVFLGIFGLFTAWILIKFKLRHPEGKWYYMLRYHHIRSLLYIPHTEQIRIYLIYEAYSDDI